MLLPLLIAIFGRAFGVAPAPAVTIIAITEYREIDLSPTVRFIDLAPTVKAIDMAPRVNAIDLSPTVLQVF